MPARSWVLPCYALLILAFHSPVWAADEPKEPALTAQDREFWSFKKPVRPEPPKVRDAGWIRTPIDAFILARLEKAGLKPAPPAERATLLRRVTFDLTGLPPTPEELDAFLQDHSPDAYARVVERLLASPHYGERWAQHWLDVVRYAETNGYEGDSERPHAWRYRDWVIKSQNDDKPYDRFLTEQIAGDLLAREKDSSPREQADLLIPTGFHRCGPVHLVSGNLDAEVGRQEVLTEMVGTVGSAILGLTLNCARCHDHKFDPISQKDYYRLQAFFAGTQPKDVDLSTMEERSGYDDRMKAIKAKIAPLSKQVSELESPVRAKLTEAKKAALEPEYRKALETDPAKRTPEQAKLAAHAQILTKVTWDEVVAVLSPADREKRLELRAKTHDLEAQIPPPAAHAWAVAEVKPVPPTYLLKRGDPKNKTARLEAAAPRVLSGEKPVKLQTRLDLAKWITRPDHPLTARVMMNRLWQHHFAQGLVTTPNDFGFRGEAPTHPELLDWLATEFTARKWSLKEMHRLMVLSNTYQQESRVPASETAKKEDPDNHLLWRMNRQRLEGEAIRDAMLAVAGTLNPKMGGPMVRVPLESEVYELIFTEGDPDGLWHVTPDKREHTRRSIYLFAKRNVRQPLFEAFDQPDTLTSCPVRPVSTFAPQALILMNGPIAQEQSKAFASRLLREGGVDEAKLIERGYQLALSRPPTAEELKTAKEFLATQTELLRDRLRARKPVRLSAELPAGVDPALAGAVVDFCLAMFNRNEFLYVR